MKTFCNFPCSLEPLNDHHFNTISLFFTGSASDVINVHSLTVSPDPVTVPGSLNVSADVSIMQDIVAPSSVELKVYKKLFGVFIEVPCIDNIGSW